MAKRSEGTRVPTSSTVAGLIARREAFYSANPDLLESYEGFHVKARTDVQGDIRLSVLFPRKTSGRKLTAAWDKWLLEWATRADAFNDKTRGPIPPPDWPYALRRWMERESWGTGYRGSYADVADELNREIMEALSTVFYCADSYDSEELRLSGRPDPEGVFYLSCARDTMTLLNVAANVQNTWIETARAQWQKGKPLFAMKDTSPHGRRLTVPRLRGPITGIAVKGFLQAKRQR